MADPLTADELAALRVDAEVFPPTDAALAPAVIQRLLATLDAQRERFVDVLLDMRWKGVLTLDRAKWERYLPDDRDGWWIAYVPFAAMVPDEVDAHYAAHPEARERDTATARRLAAEHGLGGS